MTTTIADDHRAHDADARARPRVALAGLGRAGLDHAMAIAMHPALELAGFVEPRAPLRAFARGCGFSAPASPTLAKLLATGALDALVVCAPPGERAPLVAAAVEAGLAVFVDGLASGPADEAQQIEAAAARSTRPVAAGSATLFHPLFAKARVLLASGALGPVMTVRGSAHVSRVFTPGSRPPQFDALAFTFADLAVLTDEWFGPVQAVRAHGQRLFGDWVDEARVEARLASGLDIGLDVSWSVPGYLRTSYVVEVEAERGRLLASDDALEIEDQPAGPAEMRVRRVVLAELPDALQFDAGDASALVDAFARLLAGDRAAADALDVARAIRAARLVDAARRSATDGGAVRELAT